MAYITIEVDLDEFHLDELLDEVQRRYEHYKGTDEAKIKEFMTSMLDLNESQFGLINQMKIDFLKENINEIQLTDLEKLI